jgi:hypothetical protein
MIPAAVYDMFTVMIVVCICFHNRYDSTNLLICQEKRKRMFGFF